MAMVAGVQNSWRTPILEADKMEWIDPQRNNTDMQFAKWQEYLIKLSCASYKIDPSEIGFPMSGSSDTKPMFEGNNEARLKYSKDKGLAPLLKFIEHKLNKYIVNALDQGFEFKFVGMNPENEADLVDLDIKKASSFMGYKEVRKKYNLPEKLAEGDIILNPYYMQMIQQQQQEKMQGNQQSNAAMDAENPNQGFQEDENPFAKGETNPFEEAFNQFLEKSLK
jgi:hypothetical protein